MITCQIENLNIYPVKSAHGIELEKATLTPTGLEWDRNWVVSDSNWKLISQRDKGASIMTSIHVAINSARDRLELSAPGMNDLHVPLHPSRLGAEVILNIHKMSCYGTDEGDAPREWLSTFLGRDANLVRVDLERGRITNPLDVGHDESRYAGQDGSPLLVTSVESLKRLNRDLAERGEAEIPMSRFRPNIVLAGLGPYGEDIFRELQLPERDIELRLIKQCERCPMIDVDQETGDVGATRQVLRTLVETRFFENREGKSHAMFGQDAVIEGGIGSFLRTGDRMIASLGSA